MKQKNIFNEGAGTFNNIFYMKTNASKIVYSESLKKILIIAELKKSDKVLDVGCGNGKLVNEISKITKNVKGIDKSLEMIEIAKKDFPSLNFSIGDGLNLKEKSNFYDKVVSRAVLQHLNKEQQLIFIAGINKVLKKDGEFILFVPYKSFLMRLPRYASQLFKGRKKIQGNFYSKQHIINLLVKKKFKIESINFYGTFFYLFSGYGTGFKFPIQNQKFWKLLVNIDKILSKLPLASLYSLNIIIKAKK